MSDQPESTGEWTTFGTSVKRLGDDDSLFHCSTRTDADVAIRTHNAALAAEREDKRKSLLLLTERSLQLVAEKEISGTLAEQVHQLRQQLAAEREKSDNLFSVSRKYCVENRRLRKIISSNETSLGVCVREQKQEIQQLREQRDEAIRLLECKEKQLAGVETMQRGYMTRITELEQQLAAAHAAKEQAVLTERAKYESFVPLDDQIAAAQKPLVDALKKLKAMNDFVFYPKPSEVVSIIDAALANLDF